MNTEKYIFSSVIWIYQFFLGLGFFWKSPLPPPDVFPGITKIGSLLYLYDSSNRKMSKFIRSQTIFSHLAYSVCHGAHRIRSLYRLCKIFPNTTLSLTAYFENLCLFFGLSLWFYFLLIQVSGINILFLLASHLQFIKL